MAGRCLGKERSAYPVIRGYPAPYLKQTTRSAADSCIFETNDNIPLARAETLHLRIRVREHYYRSGRAAKRVRMRVTGTPGTSPDIHTSPRRHSPRRPYPRQECTKAFRPFPDSSALCFCRRLARSAPRGNNAAFALPQKHEFSLQLSVNCPLAHLSTKLIF